MTREEAIKLLTQYIDYDAETPDYYEMEKACRVAIKALEQKPILDKIKAEIEDKTNSGQWADAVVYGMQKSIAIIDKYRKETE